MKCAPNQKEKKPLMEEKNPLDGKQFIHCPGNNSIKSRAFIASSKVRKKYSEKGRNLQLIASQLLVSFYEDFLDDEK